MSVAPSFVVSRHYVDLTASILPVQCIISPCVLSHANTVGCDECIDINCMSLCVTLTGESIGIDRIFVWGSCKFSLFTSFALDIAVCSACIVSTRFIPNNFLMGLDWGSQDPSLALPLCESSHVRTLSQTLLHTNCK